MPKLPVKKTKIDPLDFEIVQDPKTGLYYREEAKELFCIRAKNKWHKYVSEKIKEFDHKRLLNVGAHIGTWNKKCVELGLQVRSFEPIMSTVKLAQKNCPQAEVIHGAVVGNNEKEKVFYLSNVSAVSMSAVTRGRTKLTVPCFNFKKVINEFKPTVVTMDCEGGEYEILFDNEVPTCVTMLDLELHLQRAPWRESTCQELIDHLTATGWACDHIDENRNYWTQGSLHSLWLR